MLDIKTHVFVLSLHLQIYFLEGINEDALYANTTILTTCLVGHLDDIVRILLHLAQRRNLVLDVVLYTCGTSKGQLVVLSDTISLGQSNRAGSTILNDSLVSELTILAIISNR